MVHHLYTVQALTDSAEPTAFDCSYHRTPEGDVDVVIAKMHFPSGAIANLIDSYAAPAGMNPGSTSTTAATGFFRMELFGEGWALRTIPTPRPLEVFSEKAEAPMRLEIRAPGDGESATATGMMAEEQRCFLRVVRGEESVPRGATFHDALQVQGWIETLHQSALDNEAALG